MRRGHLPRAASGHPAWEAAKLEVSPNFPNCPHFPRWERTLHGAGMACCFSAPGWALLGSVVGLGAARAEQAAIPLLPRGVLQHFFLYRDLTLGFFPLLSGLSFGVSDADLLLNGKQKLLLCQVLGWAAPAAAGVSGRALSSRPLLGRHGVLPALWGKPRALSHTHQAGEGKERIFDAFSPLFKSGVIQVFQLTPVSSRASVSPSVKEGLGRWGPVFWLSIG